MRHTEEWLKGAKEAQTLMQRFLLGYPDIFIFYVSRHYRTKVLRKAVCYIFFIFEETFSYHSIYLSQPISCLHKILIQTRFLNDMKHFLLNKIATKV